MSAIVLAPPNLSLTLLQEDLEAIGDNLNVGVNIEPKSG
jgi:glycine cleavage system regulatory protein